MKKIDFDSDIKHLISYYNHLLSAQDEVGEEMEEITKDIIRKKEEENDIELEDFIDLEEKSFWAKCNLFLLVLFIILRIGGFVTSADKLLRYTIQCFQDNLPLILGTGQKLSHEMLYLLFLFRSVRIKQLISRNA